MLNFYSGGVFQNTATGSGSLTGAAIAYIGASATPGEYDVSKPTLVGLIDGALTADLVKRISRQLSQKYNLGLNI